MTSLFFAATQQLAVTPGKACEHRGAVCPTPASDVAAVEQELDEGLDFFAVQGARDKQRMEGLIA